MTTPGFKAERTLYMGRAYRQGRGAPVGLEKNGGGITPQWSCQQSCQDDAREMYFDCVTSCNDSGQGLLGQNRLCIRSCAAAKSNFLANCYATRC
jgi:hypothetical protein